MYRVRVDGFVKIQSSLESTIMPFLVSGALSGSSVEGRSKPPPAVDRFLPRFLYVMVVSFDT